MKRLRRPARAESGYSLVELLVVTAILTGILAGLTTAFVEGSKSELDTNRRVQSQIQANLALAKLRQDVHCATSGSISSATVTLTGVGCWPTASDHDHTSWCTVASGSQYNLYRLSGTSCNSTGKLYATNIVSSPVFTYTASVSGTSLAKVHIDITTNANPAKTYDAFELVDDIVLRNSTR